VQEEPFCLLCKDAQLGSLLALSLMFCDALAVWASQGLLSSHKHQMASEPVDTAVVYLIAGSGAVHAAFWPWRRVVSERGA